MSEKLLEWIELGEVEVRLDHISAVTVPREIPANRSFAFDVHLLGGQTLTINFRALDEADKSHAKLMSELTEFGE